ncbi:MAG: Hpt domain-containing protein [Chthoniobacterales bacterium]
MEILIDWDQLDMIADGYTEDFVEIYRELGKEIPSLFAELHQALADGKKDIVARAAHTIKGSTSNFGMLTLGELMKIIELHALEGNLPSVPHLLQEALVCFEESDRIIRSQRKL